MTLIEAVRARHSVRSYTDRKIEGEAERELRSMAEECNRESGLHIQLCLNEPDAFTGILAHYGKFRNVRNYIALVGKKGSGLEEQCGYYGEKMVLKAAQLGLNTCWVASTYKKWKSVADVREGEKLLIVIALGYGETQGVSHRSKPMEALCRVEGEVPGWFREGMEAAMLAPTAMNQQKFMFTLNGDRVSAESGFGVLTKLDLGIVKYHFEIGAGAADWSWQD